MSDGNSEKNELARKGAIALGWGAGAFTVVGLLSAFAGEYLMAAILLAYPALIICAEITVYHYGSPDQ